MLLLKQFYYYLINSNPCNKRNLIRSKSLPFLKIKDNPFNLENKIKSDPNLFNSKMSSTLKKTSTIPNFNTQSVFKNISTFSPIHSFEQNSSLYSIPELLNETDQYLDVTSDQFQKTIKIINNKEKCKTYDILHYLKLPNTNQSKICIIDLKNPTLKSFLIKIKFRELCLSTDQDLVFNKNKQLLNHFRINLQHEDYISKTLQYLKKWYIILINNEKLSYFQLKKFKLNYQTKVRQTWPNPDHYPQHIRFTMSNLNQIPGEPGTTYILGLDPEFVDKEDDFYEKITYFKKLRCFYQQLILDLLN